MFENRRWLVLPTSITGSINFNEVLQNSADTLRLSLNGSKTFVKYDVRVVEETYTETFQNPETGEDTTHTIEQGVYGRPSIYSSDYIEYTYSEILELLSGEEWTNNDLEP